MRPAGAKRIGIALRDGNDVLGFAGIGPVNHPTKVVTGTGGDRIRGGRRMTALAQEARGAVDLLAGGAATMSSTPGTASLAGWCAAPGWNAPAPMRSTSSTGAARTQRRTTQRQR
jgi:hypothetical protein